MKPPIKPRIKKTICILSALVPIPMPGFVCEGGDVVAYGASAKQSYEVWLSKFKVTGFRWVLYKLGKHPKYHFHKAHSFQISIPLKPIE